MVSQKCLFLGVMLFSVAMVASHPAANFDDVLKKIDDESHSQIKQFTTIVQELEDLIHQSKTFKPMFQEIDEGIHAFKKAMSKAEDTQDKMNYVKEIVDKVPMYDATLKEFGQFSLKLRDSRAKFRKFIENFNKDNHAENENEF
uniref:Uncharacterized protein n=1 Tax=Cacopsylla melanoneura TaxID=428564 RepID=A0A8D9BZH2_9HEMI